MQTTSETRVNTGVKSGTVLSLVEEVRFPQSLMVWRDYDGARLLAAFTFVLAVAYFIYGFLAPQNWLGWTISHIPILGSAFGVAATMWRLSLVALSYCLLWLTFDRRSLSGYAMGAFTVLFGIVYILSPLDFIPDVLPVMGQVDDATIGAGSILLGVKSWLGAQAQSRTQALVSAAMRRGDRDAALALLLNAQGIHTKQ